VDQRHDAIGRVVGGSGILVQIHHVRPVADRSGTGHSAVVGGGLITTGDCLLVCRSGGRRTGNGRGSVQSLPGEVFEIGLCGKEATTRGLVREAPGCGVQFAVMRRWQSGTSRNRSPMTPVAFPPFTDIPGLTM
jgi:hypothetical protein